MLLAEDGHRRLHRNALRGLLESTTGPVRIASAYVTEVALLKGISRRNIQLLASLSRMDIVSGASSLDALRSLIELGVQCRYTAGNPRLHGKVYLFHEEAAVVTSANLTRSALNSNIEVGIRFGGNFVRELAAWFDRLWPTARPLDLAQLARLDKETAALRRAYLTLRQRVSEATMLIPNEQSTEVSAEEMAFSARRRRRRSTIAGTKDGDATLWQSYLRHRPPPQGDAAVTAARTAAETIAAELSHRLNKSVYVYAYHNRKLELIRLSIGVDDRPNWPKFKRGRIEKIGIWRDGLPLKMN